MPPPARSSSSTPTAPPASDEGQPGGDTQQRGLSHRRSTSVRFRAGISRGSRRAPRVAARGRIRTSGPRRTYLTPVEPDTCAVPAGDPMRSVQGDTERHPRRSRGLGHLAVGSEMVITHPRRRRRRLGGFFAPFPPDITPGCHVARSRDARMPDPASSAQGQMIRRPIFADCRLRPLVSHHSSKWEWTRCTSCRSRSGEGAGEVNTSAQDLSSQGRETVQRSSG